MHVTALLAANHFHMQAHGQQPPGPPTDPGIERVELLTDGRGWFDLGDGSLQAVGPGDLLWHAAGDRSICRSDPEAPYACLSLRFAVNPKDPRRPVPRHTRWDEIDRVRSFTREVIRHHLDPRFDRQALLHYTYGRLLFVAQRSLHLAGQPNLHPGLARVVQHVASQFWQTCTIPELADLAGCSASQLHALFRRQFGLSPHRYLLERRLHAAREQLAGGEDALATIARRCGFADASALCRAFHRASGISPQRWREQERARW